MQKSDEDIRNLLSKFQPHVIEMDIEKLINGLTMKKIQTQKEQLDTMVLTNQPEGVNGVDGGGGEGQITSEGDNNNENKQTNNIQNNLENEQNINTNDIQQNHHQKSNTIVVKNMPDLPRESQVKKNNLATPGTKGQTKGKMNTNGIDDKESSGSGENSEDELYDQEVTKDKDKDINQEMELIRLKSTSEDGNYHNENDDEEKQNEYQTRE